MSAEPMDTLDTAAAPDAGVCAAVATHLQMDAQFADEVKTFGPDALYQQQEALQPRIAQTNPLQYRTASDTVAMMSAAPGHQTHAFTSADGSARALLDARARAAASNGGAAPLMQAPQVVAAGFGPPEPAPEAQLPYGQTLVDNRYWVGPCLHDTLFGYLYAGADLTKQEAHPYRQIVLKTFSRLLLDAVPRLCRYRQPCLEDPAQEVYLMRRFSATACPCFVKFIDFMEGMSWSVVCGSTIVAQSTCIQGLSSA